MTRKSGICAILLILTAGAYFATGQTVVQKPAQPMPSGEQAGQPPYEIVRAGRTQPHPPLVAFDSLDGWTVEGRNGAVADLFESQKERVWNSKVARLVYRGSSADSEVKIAPDRPLPLPADSTAVTLWVYGNNWEWENDPATPRVQLDLLLTDGAGQTRTVPLEKVRWKEWWLIYRLLPPEILDGKQLSFAGIAVKGCGNKEDKELFFEDLAFFKEQRRPLSFEPRPQRGVDLFPGQGAGANTGSGRLPFPTRTETILPQNFASGFNTSVEKMGDKYALRYTGPDTKIEYLIAPEIFFRNIKVRINGTDVATAWVDGGPSFGPESGRTELVEFKEEGGVVRGAWKVTLPKLETRVEMAARLWQKSLVIDTICGDGAQELSFGSIQHVAGPELITLPYLNYGGHHLNVLMSKGKTPFFAGIWMDWYRSNASEPYAVDKIEQDRIVLNGGMRYLPKTDGTRNGMFERTFLTFSPAFEETLPTIPNPPAKRGKEAGTRLWQETWGPTDYREERERSALLRAYGIEQLTQCNHEITWRDSGESFTFRLEAAPKRGGDDGLKRYVEAQKALGWRSGLYSNYTDFAPVNSYWDPDMVMRASNGELIRAWARCYAPKALFAVEMDRKLAPAIVQKFGSNAAYTDVHTSVSPWDRCDFDARVPGAGTFAATFYAFGELLLHDQDVYDGHCWSEGNHQWLYAGLTTGNYGLTYSDLRLWQYPYLPHFDLMSMHPLTVDIGMPWTEQFFSGKEGWKNPENIVASIDQFIAATIAYGHMGWLVEEAHGMRQTCRSYYMLQQLQSRYLMERIAEIKYGAGEKLVSSSQALLSGAWKQGMLYIKYANGLQVWVNGNDKAAWVVNYEGQRYTLPSFGWLAAQGKDFITMSVEEGGKRFDRLASPDYVFVDGRGTVRDFDGVQTDGSWAIRAGQGNDGISVTAVEAGNGLKLSVPKGTYGGNDVRNRLARLGAADTITIRAYGSAGKILSNKQLQLPRPPQPWQLPLTPPAVRYEVGTDLRN
jgi:hypothetical protein